MTAAIYTSATPAPGARVRRCLRSRRGCVARALTVHAVLLRELRADTPIDCVGRTARVSWDHRGGAGGEPRRQCAADSRRSAWSGAALSTLLTEIVVCCGCFVALRKRVSDRLEAQPAQERAFLQSVVYAALFDYPLTLEQLRESLIGELADERTLLALVPAQRLPAGHDRFLGRIFLSPRTTGSADHPRRSRANESRPAAPALRTARLDHAPAVCADGGALGQPGSSQRRRPSRSGSLRRHLATPRVDGDAHHLAAGATAWLATAPLPELRRIRAALWVAPADLFSANQIVHLQPVIGEETYRRFLDANRFVERFYPNFAPRQVRTAGGQRFGPSPSRGPREVFDWTVAPLLEWMCRLVYRTHLAQPRSHLDIARSGAPRAGMPQAAHLQPSPRGDGALRAGARGSRGAWRIS